MNKPIIRQELIMQIFKSIDKKGMSFEKSSGIYEGIHESLDYLSERGYLRFKNTKPKIVYEDEKVHNL